MMFINIRHVAPVCLARSERFAPVTSVFGSTAPTSI